MITALRSVGSTYHPTFKITKCCSGESRIISNKYHETKLLSQFLRVARDLTKVDLVGSGIKYTSSAAISTSELRNPDTNSAFYVTIHTSSQSTALTPFKLNVSTSVGNFTVPQSANDIVLNGRQSKIIVTDFPVGGAKLRYSTAEVFTVSTQGKKTVVLLWLPTGESGEFLLSGVRSGHTLAKHGCSGLLLKKTDKGIITSYTQLEGQCVLEFDNTYRFVLLDRSTAYKTWVPSTSKDPLTPENSTGEKPRLC
jgi:hypothetical protein